MIPEVKPPVCVRVLRFFSPKIEQERMEYRRCMSLLNAHLEDLTRTTSRIVKRNGGKEKIRA